MTLSDSGHAEVALIRGTHSITEISVALFMDLRTQMAGSARVQPDGVFEVLGIENGTYTVLVVNITNEDIETARFTTAAVTVNGSDVTLDLTLP